MLVEKKSWKNLIKPVVITIMTIIIITLLFQIGINGKYDSPIGELIAMILIPVSFVIGLAKIDFRQIVKVNDLSTLNDEELKRYGNNFTIAYFDDGKINKRRSIYPEEFQRVLKEIESRETIKLSINKKCITKIMKFISDSNVIPLEVKESLKIDMLNNYKNDEDSGEFFITSKKNAAYFITASKVISSENKDYEDYDLVKLYLDSKGREASSIVTTALRHYYPDSTILHLN